MSLSPIISILAVLFFTIRVWSADRLAVLVNSGDPAELKLSMQELERKGRETYTTLGYKVVVIEALRAPLLRTLGTPKGVRDLRLDFIGHGTYVDPSPSTDRFPPLSPQKKAFAIFNGGGNDVARAIGVGDIQRALALFRQNNPRASASLHFLNCHSGAVAEQLRREPKTIVFANTPATESAINSGDHIDEGGNLVNATNGLRTYYETLSRREKKLTHAQAWSSAQLAFAEKLFRGQGYQIGRLPMTQSVIGWCNETGQAAAPPTESLSLPLAAPNSSHEKLIFPIRKELSKIAELMKEEPTTEQEFARLFSDGCEKTKSCKPEPIAEWKRMNALLEKDLKCLERFKTEAPADEWENLERLTALAGRPTRGN